MQRPAKPLLALLALVFVAALAGCSNKTEADNTIPWSRPAAWEGGVPGMGGMGTPGSGYR